MMTASPASRLKTTIVLRNIPRTALVPDIRRLLTKQRVENVQNVYLDHRRFFPVGKAFVSFSHPGHVTPAFSQLRSAQMSGLPVDVAITHTVEKPTGRSRGVRGREEATNRGILLGDGPDAGVHERGKNVVMWGLPGKLTPEDLRELLKVSRLTGSVNGEEDIIKIEPDGRAGFTSRFYVRAVSSSEAHRLVRQFHMTRYFENRPEIVIQARVIY